MYLQPHPPRTPPIRSTLGLACLGVGTVGLVLPLIPGIPFLIAGALLLRGPRTRAPSPAPRRGSLSGAERVQLQFWLWARRITTTAESIRLARRARARRARQRHF